MKEKIFRLDYGCNSSYLFWIFFVFIIAIQFFLFRNYVIREVVNFYPVAFDQTSYLFSSYNDYESIKKIGLINTLLANLGSLNTFFFPLQAAVLYLFLGASRLSALYLNFIFFSLLQVFLVYTSKKISGSIGFALFLLGLFFLVKTTFLYSGGIFDFRIDFSAFCLYGIICCCILNSNVFLYRKWLIIAAFFSLWLIFIRPITYFYLIGLWGFYWIYFFILNRLNTHSLSEHIKQNLNSKLFFCFILFIGLVYFFYNKESFYNYYIVGHFLSQEKLVRAKEYGITSSYSSLFFYPHSLIYDHMGPFLEKISLLSLFVACLSGKYIFNGKSKEFTNSNSLFFLLLSIAVPLVILTIDLSKSPVVGGVIVIPFLFCIAWPFLCMQAKFFSIKYIKLIFLVFYIAIFCFGFYNLVGILVKKSSSSHKEELVTLNRMYNDIFQFSLKNNWNKIVVSETFIRDSVGPHVFKIFFYEKYSKLINVQLESLGSSLFPSNEKDALLSLSKSNVFIETVGKLPASPYPFEESIAAIKPALDSYAIANFKQLNDYPFNGEMYRVYVRV
jgi:hypothetical protein